MAGRPKSAVDLPEGWYNDILEMYQEGASDVEVKAYIYSKRKTFSNDLWDRWLQEEPEFSEVIEIGRRLSIGKKPLISEIRKEKLLLRRKKRNYKKEYLNSRLILKNRIIHSQRSLLNFHLKRQGLSKSKKTFELFGYSPKELFDNIRIKLKDGMTFDNYGLWHVDHIKPLSKFDLKKEDEIKKAWHFNNLQCLWAIDNLKKGNRYSENTVNYG